jgi:two-component system phosphate regulon sensor histidine kinase PhoR
MIVPDQRLSRAVMASAAPVALVLVVLVLGGWLDAGPALLGGIALTALLAAVFWAALRDLRAVSHAIDRMAEAPGEALRLDQGGVIGRELIESVERMMRAVGADRRRLDDRVRALEVVLERAPDPLLLLGLDRIVRAANANARAALEGEPIGRSLAAVLRQPEVLEAVDLLVEGGKAPPMVEFEIGGPVRRQFRAYLSRIDADGDSGRDIGILIAMQELTELKRAERMRADFVANASHELRTPLATLVGFIETLQGPARDDQAARERFLGIMHEQGQRMTRLIRDLLSLSRIELNEHTRPQGRVDLREIADSVAKMLEPLAKAKAMPILVEAAPTAAVVMGDQDDMVQVVQNLIDNAIKYGDAGTPVTVRIGPEGASMTLAVANCGEGIPREHLPRLTERFYRVDSARSRALGGTGLGLAIVKHIVNRHRGVLTIESTEKQGATFRIVLPGIPPPGIALPGIADPGQRRPDAA